MLANAVRAFESGAATYEATAALILDVCGRSVDRHWLENYWRSEDLDVFVARLAIDAIDDWEAIDDDRAIALLNEIEADRCNDALIDRNAEALAKRYRKTDGAVIEIMRSDDPVDEQLAKLKKDTVIRL